MDNNLKFAALKYYNYISHCTFCQLNDNNKTSMTMYNVYICFPTRFTFHVYCFSHVCSINILSEYIFHSHFVIIIIIIMFTKPEPAIQNITQ